MNSKNFARFNLANLIYTLAVIVWGAFVRATGSGAGCGAHWPLCNGEVLPPTQGLSTIIEFTHRATSGISLILVITGFIFASILTKASNTVLSRKIRKTALCTVIAILLEALLGAGLVLLKLVEFDQSALRAISISLHLVNTLFLLASLTTLTWFSFDHADEKKRNAHLGKRIIPSHPFFQITLAFFVFLGVCGAVTALGDTLFPSQSLRDGFNQDVSLGAHFLLKLRVVHPLLAVMWVFLAFAWSKRLENIELLKIRSLFLLAVVIQFLLGFVP